MIDVYVLDKNLKKIGVVDAYKSLIWAKRYNALGDCELYLEASPENLELLKEGNYLIRMDDDMICQIRKIEIDTDEENGNYIICPGTDVKAILDQRLIWNIETCNGSLEDFIRSLVQKNACSPAIVERKFVKENGEQLLYLGDSSSIPVVYFSEQVSYKNLGEKIREYCAAQNWGYKVIRDGERLLFQIYKGVKRNVKFSDDYENLSSTKYVHDRTNLGNVALVAGAGEGEQREKAVYGSVSGLDRFEKFVDAKDISNTISYDELIKIYPTIAQGGTGYVDGTSYKATVNIQIVSAEHLDYLEENYASGEVITVDGVSMFHLEDAVVADLETAEVQDGTQCTLTELVYMVYLLNRGVEHLAEFGERKTFEGSVIPDVTFSYKYDYDLGDIVTVENEYGIKADARIVEIIEVMDENGYSIEPKFVYDEVI